MKAWIKRTIIEVGKMLFVITAISVCFTIVLYPFLVEQNISESMIVFRVVMGVLLALLFWFIWLYIPHARREKDWSIKNFFRYKWRKTKEATIFFWKDTKATLKALSWLALLLLGIVVVIGLLILFGSIVASLSATTIIIILLILILLK